jgi:hypothetical protein
MSNEMSELEGEISKRLDRLRHAFIDTESTLGLCVLLSPF